MGCSVSSSAVKKFSFFLDWAVQDMSYLSEVIHYLDAFFVGDQGVEKGN